jgi:hypothetical protein
MFIQVLSVLLSQEWEVIVEPSAEASFPTRMLVQLSVRGPMSLDENEREVETSRKTRVAGIIRK